MRGTRTILGLAGMALVGLVGCLHPDRPVKPNPNPEEFTLPPTSETRFTQPPTFPAKTLNDGMLRKDRDKDKDDNAPPGSYRGPGRTGAGGMN
jgi:hypothetical protein